jgi:hypothetical protein
MTFDFYQGSSSLEGREFKFGTSIDGKELSSGYNEKPLISYRYIDIEVTDYCFDQECLDADDILQYFDLLKQFSSSTINELIDGHYSRHFHLYHKPNSNLRSLLEHVSGITLTPETTPTIGQFALYNGEEKASRETGSKSPRIYFIVGQMGIMHILFYDPFHEINPGA